MTSSIIMDRQCQTETATTSPWLVVKDSMTISKRSNGQGFTNEFNGLLECDS